jgi:acyl-CoA synthetase (NDP forming)
MDGLTGAADLDALLRPRSIALVGVSPNPEIIRGRILESILRAGFDGPLHLVSRSHERIADRPCIASADELPEGVDLAIITVPAPYVEDALAACARRGVRAAVIISSGFAEERHGDGAERQQRLGRIASQHGMALLGPNAEGFLNAFTPLVATFSPVVRNVDGALIPPGVKAETVAVTSQSGGMGFAFLDRGLPRRLPFGYVVTVGNEAGCESLELMDHMLADARVGVGLMFLEGIKTAAKLEPVAARALAAGKPLVVAKVGRSEEGAAAAAAHTSSLAGSWRSYQAMFRHLGVVPVDDLDLAIDVAVGCAFLRHKLPAGKRVAVLTPSGGAGIWLTDACVAAGLELPELDAETRQHFDALLPSYGSSRNPVDLTAQFIFNRGYAEGIAIAASSPRVDAVMVASSLTRKSAVEHEYERLVEIAARSSKPIMFWSYTRPDPGCVELLAAAGIPCYTSMSGAAHAMAALADYRQAQARVTRRLELTDTYEAPVGVSLPTPPAGRSVCCEYELIPLLRGHGIPFDGELATSADHAAGIAAAARRAVALKVQSPDIAHKSDAGAVALDVRGDDAVRAAYDTIVRAARTHAPQADLHGVLVQPMARPGVEVILGLNRDPDFGLMFLAGAGGVLVELLDDTALAPPPTTADEARALLDALRTRRIFDGLRGEPRADVDALVSLMLALSRIARDLDEGIQALELNPVIVHPEGVSVVDALLVTRTPA